MKKIEDNEWERVSQSGSAGIKRWIDDQLNRAEFTIVLVGTETYSRKWIQYEIRKSRSLGIPIAGIRIHGLKDQARQTSKQGKNPFEGVPYGPISVDHSSEMLCHDPEGRTSRERYAWIEANIEGILDESKNALRGHWLWAEWKLRGIS